MIMTKLCYYNEYNKIYITLYVLYVIGVLDLTQFANKNHSKNSHWKKIVQVL